MAVNDIAPTKAQLEHRILWRDALRTSTYRQGTGALKQGPEESACLHCCLGVAEELRGCTWKHGNFWWSVVGGAETELSTHGAEWLGFSDRSGEIDFGYEGRFSTEYVTLAELNDGDCCIHGMDRIPLTFDQIADVIDYFLIRPFVPGGDRAHEVRP